MVVGFRLSLLLTGLGAIVFCLFVVQSFDRFRVQTAVYQTSSSSSSTHRRHGNRRHLSRAVIMYIPESEGNRYIAQSFAMVESWKTIYNIRTFGRPATRPNGLKGTLDKIGHVELPWLELHRKSLLSVNFAPVPDIISINKTHQLVEPDGPPLVNDIIIIAHPSNFPETSAHPDCIPLRNVRLENSQVDMEDMIKQQNLTSRVEEAIQRLDDDLLLDRPRGYDEKMAEASLGESRCFFVQSPLTTTNINIFKRHPAIHSIGLLVADIVVAITANYDIILRTDADCSLMPHFNHPRIIPWRYGLVPSQPPPSTEEENADTTATTHLRRIYPPVPAINNGLCPLIAGEGGYSGEPQNEILEAYATFLGIAHQGIHSVGSTWYGRSTELHRLGRLSVSIAEFLLKNDALFKAPEGVGTWPEWYRGVTSMYSGEMAVNALVDVDRLFPLPLIVDGLSQSNVSVSEIPVAHVHQWHTDDFFSKFQDYPLEIIVGEDVRIDQPSWYSAAHKFAGDIQFEAVLNRSGWIPLEGASVAPTELVGKLSGIMMPELIPLQKSALGCDREYPFPYNNGTHCCETENDCVGNPLKLESECCWAQKFRPCPVVGTCIEGPAPKEPHKDREKFMKEFASLNDNGVPVGR